MLRLFDITEQETTGITFETEEISLENAAVYVMYDTSTGVATMDDYYAWRALTAETDTSGVYSITIDNTTKYPKVSDDVADYTTFSPRLFKIMTWAEYEIIQMLLTRIDLVRRRFPNPGVTISDTDNIGEGGVVSFAGGWDKKFTLEEIRQMVEGSLLECNLHPPSTQFWWQYVAEASDKVYNPYTRTINGVPYNLFDLIVQGGVIRALVAWGLLEVDINFSTSDSGLSLTYDRVGPIQSWQQNLLNQYKEQKDLLKRDYMNHFGVAVATYPFAAMGWVGAAMNQVTQSGITPLSSMLGFGLRGNVPL